jgi:pimeloyl-ACP methyl ester carboxylesterase
MRQRRAEANVIVVALALAACARAGPVAPREVSFATADGGTVVADLYDASGPDAVVLAHGAAFAKESWREFARYLAARGHRVMAIDFRGWGRSVPGLGGREALYEDIVGAARDVRTRGAAHVAVVGASMGGAAAARAAAEASPGLIDRLVLLSPGPIAHPERLVGPVLFIASRDEPAAAAVTAAYERAPQPKRLLLLPGSAHGQYILATEQAERLMTTVAEFLAGSVEPPA